MYARCLYEVALGMSLYMLVELRCDMKGNRKLLNIFPGLVCIPFENPQSSF